MSQKPADLFRAVLHPPRIPDSSIDLFPAFFGCLAYASWDRMDLISAARVAPRAFRADRGAGNLSGGTIHAVADAGGHQIREVVPT